MVDLGTRRYRMPAEWQRHRRCWMAWPCSDVAFGDRLEAARELYAEIAQAIRQFEPVTMITRPDHLTSASLMCGKGISTLPMMHDDSWTRDTAPTFVLDADNGLGGVDWRFNGWGGVNPNHGEDAQMAARIIEHLGAARLPSSLTLEGGSIHVDGEGTALVCRPAILDQARNPDLDEKRFEAELADTLGIDAVIWLPNAHIDDETAGHIDNLACFVAPGHVAALGCADPKDGNQALLAQNIEILERSHDAAGRPLTVTVVQAPEPGYRDDGRRLTLSYINFYIANGGIVMPGFDDPADQAAYRQIQELFADHEIVQIQARDLVHGGGGIHCITQQQPWSALDGD